MAKYICVVILVIVQTIGAVPVPVALKKDAPKYSSADHAEEIARSPRSTSAVTSAGATQDLFASIPTTIEGAEGLLPPGSMDNLTTQLKKLKEQVELYQMINDMLKAETQVQAMPYKIDQDEPQAAKPEESTVPAAAPAVHHDDDVNHNDHHDDHHEEAHHDDQDYHHEDDQHHIDHHQQSHHQPQHQQAYNNNKRQRQQQYHH